VCFSSHFSHIFLGPGHGQSCPKAEDRGNPVEASVPESATIVEVLSWEYMNHWKIMEQSDFTCKNGRQLTTPCTTTAEYAFSKRPNSLILTIYHQTNIRVDPFARPRSHVDQVAKRVHLARGPHASSVWKDFGHVRRAWNRDQTVKFTQEDHT